MAPAGSASKRSRASWSSIISATSRCWAPSWRSRPSRRRSASPASTSRAREARSASRRARSSTSSRCVLERQRRGRGGLAQQLGLLVAAPRSWTSAPTRRPSWSISRHAAPAAPARDGRRGRRSRRPSQYSDLERRVAELGRRARRARRAGPARAARSRARPRPCGRSGVRTSPSRNAAGQQRERREEDDLQRRRGPDVEALCDDHGRDAEHEDRPRRAAARLEPAALQRARRLPAAQQDDDACVTIANSSSSDLRDAEDRRERRRSRRSATGCRRGHSVAAR